MFRATSAAAGLLAALVNIGAAFVVGGILVVAVGADPWSALKVVLQGSFGSLEGLSFTFYYATNFTLAGLAVAVAAQAAEFNIGGEGQAYVAGLGVTLMAFALPGLPWLIALVLGAGVAMAMGAAWAYVPAVMSARRGSHLVVTTIMFNFLASLVMTYVIVDLMRPADSMVPSSASIAEGLEVPKASLVLGHLGIEMRETPFNLSFLLALIACAVVTFLVWHTRWGFELRAVGANREAAAYAGVRVPSVIVQAICLSGALAGLVAVNEVLGVHHRLILDYALGIGFTGIAVALIGANHPAGIIPAAILFGALAQGGATLSFLFPSVSREVVVVLQGLVILFAGGLAPILRPRMAALIDRALARGTR